MDIAARTTTATASAATAPTSIAGTSRASSGSFPSPVPRRDLVDVVPIPDALGDVRTVTSPERLRQKILGNRRHCRGDDRIHRARLALQIGVGIPQLGVGLRKFGIGFYQFRVGTQQLGVGPQQLVIGFQQRVVGVQQLFCYVDCAPIGLRIHGFFVSTRLRLVVRPATSTPRTGLLEECGRRDRRANTATEAGLAGWTSSRRSGASSGTVAIPRASFIGWTAGRTAA